MPFLEENVHNWMVNETTGLIEGRLKNLPDNSALSRLTQGKNKKIWDFVSKHVKSKQSVAFTRKILLLRRAVKEREKYPDTDSINYVILKNQVDNAEDKVRFVEHCTNTIIKRVYSCKTYVKNKKEENCILRQRCSILELATLNLKEKNESLNIIIDQIYALLSKSFANDKTKFFENPSDRKLSTNVICKMIHDLKFSNDDLNSIINEIILIVKHKLFGENVNIPITNLVVPVTRIMSFTPSKDLINMLKHTSQKDLDSLQKNIEVSKQKEVERLSEKYLQSMKLDLVDSCFQRKLHHTKCLMKFNDIHFNEDIGKLQQDYLALYIQNICLADSIDYLEKKITSEQSITENLKENNLKEKSRCQNIKIIMEDFHKTLEAVYILSDSLPETFSSIQFSLESCRSFIECQVLFPIQCNKDNYFFDVINQYDREYELSSELLRNREFLQDFLKDFTFTKLNFPAKIWEFLSLEPFKNRHLLIEKLFAIKAKLSIEPHHYCYEVDEISPSIAKRMTSTVEDNTDNLEVVNKNLFQVKKNCKNLDIVLNDWLYQNAQFIPKIEYHGKTLKMWLAILNALDDIEF